MSDNIVHIYHWVIAIFSFSTRRKISRTTGKSSQMLSNRTYGMTEIVGNGITTGKKDVMYENLPREPPEGQETSYFSNTKSKEPSQMYAEVRKNNLKTSREEDKIPIVEEKPSHITESNLDSLGDNSTSTQAGWMENTIYDTSAADEHDKGNNIIPKPTDNTTEGWKDNSLYSSSGESAAT